VGGGIAIIRSAIPPALLARADEVIEQVQPSQVRLPQCYFSFPLGVSADWTPASRVIASSLDSAFACLSIGLRIGAL